MLLPIQAPELRICAEVRIQLNGGAIGGAATLQIDYAAGGWLRLNLEPPLPCIDEQESLTGRSIVGGNLDLGSIGGKAAIEFEDFGKGVLRHEFKIVAAGRNRLPFLI